MQPQTFDGIPWCKGIGIIANMLNNKALLGLQVKTDYSAKITKNIKLL